MTSSDEPSPEQVYIAFAGDRRIGFGSLRAVASAVKQCDDAGADRPLLVFDAVTSELQELDLRGSPDDVLARIEAATPEAPSVQDSARLVAEPTTVRVGPGRPRLGVVAREITLLPRHWQWLSEQPGGASVTIRRLVEEARTVGAERDRLRRAKESAYRFMNAMAGDQPGFEEATRALFAGEAARFSAEVEAWPPDLRLHAHQLAGAVFDA